MRFVPAPGAASAPPTLTQPPQMASRLTFASVLGAAQPATAATHLATNLAATATLRTVDATLLGVARLAPRPVADVALGWHRRINLDGPLAADEIRCEYADQYSIGEEGDKKLSGVSRFCELLYGTLFRNKIPDSRLYVYDENGLYVYDDTGKKIERTRSKLLGDTGHYERFSTWSHVVGFVGFIAYAIVRQVVAQNRDAVEGVLCSVAAWTIACVFLASSIYHGTAADVDYAMVTRLLDFVAIYAGLAVGATADIAAATRGFENVPVVTIVDIPIAAVLLVFFFVWRRLRVPKEATWSDDYVEVPPRVECTVGRGLFSRGHGDLHHSQLREATSLLLTASYFMAVPAAVMTLGASVAIPVVLLQAVSFVFAVGGMLLDKIFEWPNRALVEGRQAYCYPNPCGCVLTAHGVWHLIALVSAACNVIAREYALASYG